MQFKDLEKKIPNLRALVSSSDSNQQGFQNDEILALIKVFEHCSYILTLVNSIAQQGHVKSFRDVCSDTKFFGEAYSRINQKRLFFWDKDNFDFYIKEDSYRPGINILERLDEVRDMCEEINRDFNGKILETLNGKKGNFLNFVEARQFGLLDKLLSQEPTED